MPFELILANISFLLAPMFVIKQVRLSIAKGKSKRIQCETAKQSKSIRE